MKTFRSKTIKSITGVSKIIIEVPHRMPAKLYETNMKMTDFISESSNTRLRDDLFDKHSAYVIKNLGELIDSYDTSGYHHQGNRVQWLIVKWCEKNLTNAEYLSLFGYRKSKGDE